jgi:hypothetical protein
VTIFGTEFENGLVLYLYRLHRHPEALLIYTQNNQNNEETAPYRLFVFCFRAIEGTATSDLDVAITIGFKTAHSHAEYERWNSLYRYRQFRQNN